MGARCLALIALALALLPSFAAEAQTGSASLVWTPPTTNTDGSPLTNLAGYVVYHGLSPTSLPDNRTLQGQATGYVWDALPVGTHYFAVTAVNTASVESVFSNLANKDICCAPPLLPPGPVLSLVVTPVIQPSLSVTVGTYSASSGEFSLTITGAGAVAMRALSGQFDWCKPGGENGTVATPTVPDLGIANNAPPLATIVTLTAPIATTICDIDPNIAFPGIEFTANGVSKTLTQSGVLSW